MLRRKGLKPASQNHCKAKTRAQNLRLSKARGPHPTTLQWLNVELEARVSTAEEIRVSVITVLITGSVTAYVMRGVNPHYGGFLGDNFIPETSINSSACY